MLPPDWISVGLIQRNSSFYKIDVWRNSWRAGISGWYFDSTSFFPGFLSAHQMSSGVVSLTGVGYHGADSLSTEQRAILTWSIRRTDSQRMVNPENRQPENGQSGVWSIQRTVNPEYGQSRERSIRWTPDCSQSSQSGWNIGEFQRFLREVVGRGCSIMWWILQLVLYTRRAHCRDASSGRQQAPSFSGLQPKFKRGSPGICPWRQYKVGWGGSICLNTSWGKHSGACQAYLSLGLAPGKPTCCHKASPYLPAVAALANTQHTTGTPHHQLWYLRFEAGCPLKSAPRGLRSLDNRDSP